MTDMDALFILYWRTTTNQFLFIYPPVRLNMRHWRIILPLFFIKSCDFFVSIFLFFFYYFYMHMYVTPPRPVHSPTHPLSRKWKKNRVEGRVEHAREVKCLFAITAATARALLPICSARSPHGCCGAQSPNSSPRLKLNFTRSCNLLQLLCLEWEVSDLWTQISGSGLRNLWFRIIVALIQIWDCWKWNCRCLMCLQLEYFGYFCSTLYSSEEVM